MKLVSLHLHQWRSFEDCPLDLPDGLIGVRGPNGAGKSTVAEAIGWALFGKLRHRGRVDELRRQGAPSGDASFVDLVFQLDSTIYRVRRVVGKDAKLWINGQLESTKSRDTTARIARELDLTWEVFERTVFAQQNDVAALGPGVSKEDRRAHVERLLGLSKFGEAARRARTDAKAIEQQLLGRRAVAPDLAAIEEELGEAERQATHDDPVVAQAEQDYEKADKARSALRTALDAERERSARAQSLTKDIEHARQLAERAETGANKLRPRIAVRETKRLRLAQIAPEAKKAADAQTLLARWDEFGEASRDLNEIEGALAAIAFDSDAADRDAERLDAIRQDQADLKNKRVEVAARVEGQSARVAALREGLEAGPSAEHKTTLEALEQERESLVEELAVTRSSLAHDRAHIQEVAEGGPNTPCPVCKKPYGSEYDEILNGYRKRIEEAEARIPELDSRLTELVREHKSASGRVDRSRRAEERISETTGPLALADGEQELSLAQGELAQTDKRIAEIDVELAGLGQRVQDQVKIARRWHEHAAVRDDRAKRWTQAAQALNAEGYDTDLHERVRAERDRLRALADEATQMQADVNAGATLEAELASEQAAASTARETESKLTEALAELAFDPVKLDELSRLFDEVAQARDDASERVQAARLAAQERSQVVQDLRRRREEARGVKRDIARAEIDMRQHKVAADLLNAYRAHRNRRAWPFLEQGAGALLAATTDGRYADVRLSDDYRLLIVDRGETHNLTRFSGGEQDLANLCLRLAIADWVARERGVEIGFVVLDEVFGSQDEERRGRLLGELRALAARFRQVLVITHLPDIADLCDEQLDVSLDQPGTSTAGLVSSR